MIQQLRSVSEGAVPRQVANSYFAGRTFNNHRGADPNGTFEPFRALTNGYLTSRPAQKSSDDWLSSGVECTPEDASHAISTTNNVPIESPPARKIVALAKLYVPPRTSSKHSPLPSPMHDEPDVPTSRLVKHGSTKWPILGNSPSRTNNETIDPADGIHEATMRICSIENNSNGSLPAVSNVDDLPEQHEDSSARIKRQSWRSSNSGSGPILTIFEDADAVLLGRDNLTPSVPKLPTKVNANLLQKRSMSSLASRISKQSRSRFSTTGLPRLTTPGAEDHESGEHLPVKIYPIRSMQPPRQSSLESFSPLLSSPMSLAVLNTKIIGQQSVVVKAADRCSSETSVTSSAVLSTADENSSKISATSGRVSHYYVPVTIS